jgi:hypothetical protein
MALCYPRRAAGNAGNGRERRRHHLRFLQAAGRRCAALPAGTTHRRFPWALRGIALAVSDREHSADGPLEGHSPDQERPLGGYAVLMGTFGGLAAGFGTWLHRSGRQLPDMIAPADLLLATVAAHKCARVLARDRVTSTVRAPFTRFQGDAGPSEVDEKARGRGLRRALAELLVCPYCLDMWVGSGFIAGLIVAPRATRWVAATFTVQAGADALQIVYSKAESAL